MIEDDRNTTLKILDQRGEPSIEIWEQCGHMVIRMRSQISSVEVALSAGESKLLYDFMRKFAKRFWTEGKPW